MSVATEEKTLTVAEISKKLQHLQRQRAWVIKTRNMVNNRLQATIAGTIGYSASLTESERKKLFAEAGVLIKRIVAGEVDSPMIAIVMATQIAINAYEVEKAKTEKNMKVMAKQLPIAEWVDHPDQRGFGLLFLAIVVGETGDLANYANPAKVWRRMGCAPFTKDGETHCGATWRSRGKNKKGLTKLHASDWEDFGYSPRRRSIAYLIGEGIVKQNFVGGNGAGENDVDTQEKCAGPYRRRYDTAKARAAETHPEWMVCPKCEGMAKTLAGAKCANCKGTGQVWLHCHRHGMLLAAKELMKRLWVEWNGRPKEHRGDW